MDFCPTCKKYDSLGHHVCAPIWEVAIDQGKNSELYWQECRAQSEEAAAERYADDYDCQGDYTIIQAGDGGETEILVRRPNGVGGVKRFHVVGETVAQYHAREIFERTPTNRRDGE